VKLLNDRAYRLDWAERVGTGFVLPVGQPGLLHLVRKLRKLLKAAGSGGSAKHLSWRVGAHDRQGRGNNERCIWHRAAPPSLLRARA